MVFRKLGPMRWRWSRKVSPHGHSMGLLFVFCYGGVLAVGLLLFGLHY
jgi:hypothetical protein